MLVDHDQTPTATRVRSSTSPLPQDRLRDTLLLVVGLAGLLGLLLVASAATTT